MIRLNDLVGQRFGHLVVRERTPYRGKHAGVYWLCECDCGGSKEVSSHSLRRGNAASFDCAYVYPRSVGGIAIVAASPLVVLEAQAFTARLGSASLDVTLSALRNAQAAAGCDVAAS